MMGAAVGCGLVILICWAILLNLRSVLEAAKLLHPWVSALLVGVALLLLLLLIPLSRAIRDTNKARAFLLTHEVIEARVHIAEAREWAWYALGYGGAVLLVALFVLFVIANNVAVGSTFFKLPLIFGSMGLVLKAFWINVKIFCIAQVLVLIWGLVVAIARMLPGRAGQPVRFLATVYTDVFRGLPSIISIYLIGFGLPLTGLPWVRDWPLEWLAILALTVTYGAYVAEVYRAGIESIHPSQTMAARSLGLSFGQTLRFVIVPQAIRRIIPPLLNDFISLQKDTALVNVIGAIDGFNQSRIIASNRFNLSAVTTVALLFMLITIPQTRFVDRLLERENKRMRS
jgi:polar amino acid transport system permease protein